MEYTPDNGPKGTEAVDYATAENMLPIYGTPETTVTSIGLCPEDVDKMKLPINPIARIRELNRIRRTQLHLTGLIFTRMGLRRLATCSERADQSLAYAEETARRNAGRADQL